MTILGSVLWQFPPHWAVTPTFQRKRCASNPCLPTKLLNCNWLVVPTFTEKDFADGEARALYRAGEEQNHSPGANVLDRIPARRLSGPTPPT